MSARIFHFGNVPIVRLFVTIFTIITAVVCLISPVTAGEIEITNPSAFIGQWIWSHSDEQIFQDSRKRLPSLVPCVWVSTITVSKGKITQQLANPPALVRSAREMAIVIRFDDSFHTLWGKRRTDEIAYDLDTRLHTLLDLITGAGVVAAEVQLDYDCPVRWLDKWAKVLRTVSNGSLKGKRIWITSLPSHLMEPRFASWFRSAVAGHILQLFDTGVTCEGETVRKLTDRIREQNLRFRIGLGAFERPKTSQNMNHRLWFSALPVFSTIPGYQGVWIFPGGKRWISII